MQWRCNWLPSQEAGALFSKVRSIHQHQLLMWWPTEESLCQNPIKHGVALVQNINVLTQISDMSSEDDITKRYDEWLASGHPCLPESVVDYPWQEKKTKKTKTNSKSVIVQRCENISVIWIKANLDSLVYKAYPDMDQRFAVPLRIQGAVWCSKTPTWKRHKCAISDTFMLPFHIDRDITNYNRRAEGQTGNESWTSVQDQPVWMKE